MKQHQDAFIIYAVFKVTLYRLCLIETIDCILIYRCSKMFLPFYLIMGTGKTVYRGWEFERIVIIIFPPISPVQKSKQTNKQTNGSDGHPVVEVGGGLCFSCN